MARFDVIVIGLGAVGSAATFHLARNGRRVLGIDRARPPHKLGSSHGETRITRVAIGEGMEYTPLAIRSQELWRMIEDELGADGAAPLLVPCGCLFVPGSGGVHGVKDFLENIRTAADTYRIPHAVLGSGREIRERFPQFNVGDDDKAFLDQLGGYVRPEACIRA
jgi:sarcosine oxidase